MKTVRGIGVGLLFWATVVQAQFEQPYHWSHSEEGARLVVEVSIPSGAYLYVEQTSVQLQPSVSLMEAPIAQSHTDEFGTSDILLGGQSHRWVYSIDSNAAYQIQIRYQGCGVPEGGGGAVCYAPATETFAVGGAVSQITAPVSEKALERASVDSLLDQFEMVRTGGGMKSPTEMLAFLDTDALTRSTTSSLAGKSVWFTILFVLLGGMALNLTPCVLPMIPINLAIIGAGAAAATKRQGFVRGGVYGLGIALAYGGLGLFAVLTGSQFGTLNSSSIFNFIIAGVFIVLALALFDVLSIDLSRFGSKFGISNEKRGRLVPAFLMGVVAALLAGACVAPILIAVLLQSTAMVAGGNPFGFFLPLLLGVGMALPWPIAGAGLTILPKPGSWMVKVKQGFGGLILLFALYYAWLGVELLPRSVSEESGRSALSELEQSLQEAYDTEQWVFIDFWASWCKTCLKMDATTFKNPEVVARLHDFKEIKFQAEKLADPQIKAILNRYNLPGLPGYVILRPKK